MKLIFFDLDGVLTPTVHGVLLAEIVDREDKLNEIPKKIYSGTDKMGLEWMIKEMAKIFKGIPESTLVDAGKRLPVTEGALTTIRILKNCGYKPILITNGIEQLAGVFARRLGITEWYGNTFEIRNGKTTGCLGSSPLLTLQSKGDLVRKVVTQKSSRRESVAVGNDVNDWSMLQEAGISILFNPSPNLGEHMKWCIDRGEKGFKREFIAYSAWVDAVIEKPDLRLLLPFVVATSPCATRIDEIAMYENMLKCSFILQMVPMKELKNYKDKKFRNLDMMKRKWQMKEASETANFKNLQQLLEEFGYIKYYVAILKALAESKDFEEIMMMIGLTPEIKRKMEKRMKYLLNQNSAPLLSGAAKSLRLLKNMGLLFCIATDNYNQIAVRVIHEYGLSDMFESELILANDTFPIRKPSSKVVEELIKRSGRKRALILGNTPKEVALARNSGCPAVIMIDWNEAEGKTAKKKDTFEYEWGAFGGISGKDIHSVKNWGDAMNAIIEIIQKKSMGE